jgi:hypothetical protein
MRNRTPDLGTMLREDINVISCSFVLEENIDALGLLLPAAPKN